MLIIPMLSQWCYLKNANYPNDVILRMLIIVDTTLTFIFLSFFCFLMKSKNFSNFPFLVFTLWSAGITKILFYQSTKYHQFSCFENHHSNFSFTGFEHWTLAPSNPQSSSQLCLLIYKSHQVQVVVITNWGQVIYNIKIFMVSWLSD